jgi:hypothetical protein
MRYAVLAAWFLSAACAAEAKPGDLSLEQAQPLIRDFILRNNPDIATLGTIQLQDLTPADVRSEMRVQIFKVSDGPKAYHSFIIGDGTVSDFCTGIGGHGLQSLCLCDLDGDGQREIAYTFSWGSGIHRTQIGVYSKAVQPPQILVAWSYCGDLFVSPREDGGITVESGNYTATVNSWNDAAPFGRLTMKKDDPQVTIDVELSDALSEEDKKKIWKDTHE